MDVELSDRSPGSRTRDYEHPLPLTPQMQHRIPSSHSNSKVGFGALGSVALLFNNITGPGLKANFVLGLGLGKGGRVSLEYVCVDSLFNWSIAFGTRIELTHWQRFFFLLEICIELKKIKINTIVRVTIVLCSIGGDAMLIPGRGMVYVSPSFLQSTTRSVLKLRSLFFYIINECPQNTIDHFGDMLLLSADLIHAD
jgi:hypothetical protein